VNRGRQLWGGSSVFLTLDVNIQRILETIASRVLDENKAEAVMFTAMEPRTGDILGAASLPGFDPNNFRDTDPSLFMNRPAMWAYEPGSVFKIFSLSALMEGKAVAEDSFFTCTGQYELTTEAGVKIIINCTGSHGKVSAREIIMYSRNAGAAYAADMMDVQPFNEYLRDFGFGNRTKTGNPLESAGLLSPIKTWSMRTKPTLATGREIAVSALQMLQAASTIANDGVLVPPRIVSRIISADGKTVENYESGKPRRVLSHETAQAMRGFMQDAYASIGADLPVNAEGLSLAVKSGSAQIVDRNTRAYSRTDYIASCIAMFPAESPSLILYLVIIKPQDPYQSGRITVPPIREAAEAINDYFFRKQYTYPSR